MKGSDPRFCKNCGTKVIYSWIWDAHDPRPFGNFVKEGTEDYMRCCPTCNIELTITNTDTTKPKKKSLKKKRN